MRALIEKLQRIEKNLSAERGSFNLFGIFLRPESEGAWDLVVSADWLPSDDLMSYRLLADKTKQELTEEELVEISRIVLLGPGDLGVRAFTQVVSIEHGDLHVKNCKFNGMPIKEAWVITAKRKRYAIER